MQINLDTRPEAYSIHSYGDHYIVVNSPTILSEDDDAQRILQPGQTTLNNKKNSITLTASAIITPEKLISHWRPQTMKELTEGDLEVLSDLQPELVILGTGKQIIFPDQSYTLPLMRQGIGVEVMNTAAACRTYNFLMTDGRQVLAALFMR